MTLGLIVERTPKSDSAAMTALAPAFETQATGPYALVRGVVGSLPHGVTYTSPGVRTLSPKAPTHTHTHTGDRDRSWIPASHYVHHYIHCLLRLGPASHRIPASHYVHHCLPCLLSLGPTVSTVC